MNTKKKILSLVVIVALMIATFSMMMIGCKPKPTGGTDGIALKVDMGDQYYVGANGAVTLSTIFGKEKCAITKGDSASISGDTLTVNGTTPFEMSVGKDTKKATIVADGYNVSTYADFFAKVKEGKIVVVQATDFAMVKENGTISVKNSIYGNGVNIDGTNVAAASGKKGWKTAGNVMMSVEVENKLVIRDVHTFGIKTDPKKDIHQFNNVGSSLSIGGTSKGAKSNVDVIHCVFENGHKVVHLNNSNVYMEGCIVRNAADTTISVGTWNKKASTVTLKNNVVANSLTAGIVIYDFDGDIKKDDKATWNTINIEGFLDIYNWRSAKGLAFLPDTELNGNQAVVGLINKFVASDISPEKEYADLKSVGADKSQYLHMGIFKICTSPNFKTNNSIIKFDGKEIKASKTNLDNSKNIGYAMQDFPMPGIAAMVAMKQAVVVGYFGNNKGAITTESKMTEKNISEIYQQLRQGR